MAKGRQEGRLLTVKQVGALASRAKLGRQDWGPLVWLLATTGLRPGEAVALDVADVDAARRRIRVRKSKTGTARDVPVPASVLAMLELDHDGPLFVGVRGDRLNLHWWRDEVFTPARKAAKVDCRPYDLRHTAVSWGIAAGADVKVVQRMVGHKSAKMTLDVYAHMFDSALDDVADRMDAGVFGPTG